MSYIDVRHPNLLPSNLIVGEAQDLSPWLVRANSLVPMRDASVDSVFQGRVVHLLVEEARVEVWPTDQAEVESINSSEIYAYFFLVVFIDIVITGNTVGLYD